MTSVMLAYGESGLRLELPSERTRVVEPTYVPGALGRLMVRAGATTASMLQDLERGRKTEVDVINGGVVDAAALIGRAAPLNAELTRIVHEYEQGLARPGAQAFERLRAVSTDATCR